jgi:F-type H+-transporting ATPase subunit delta
VSTSEAQVSAHALYDSLIGGALQTLKAAAAKIERGDSNADVEGRITAALPPEAPRELRNFLLALAREGALGQLPDIVRAFERYTKGANQTISGEIISAVALDDTQRAHISDELRERYGNQLELRFNVDPSLIGGLIIRIGDQVLDNSLRARLSTVQRNMLSS